MKIFLTRDLKKGINDTEYALWFVDRGRIKQFFIDNEGHWGIDNKPGQCWEVIDNEEPDGFVIFHALKSVIKSFKLNKGEIVEVKMTIFATSMKQIGKQVK